MLSSLFMKFGMLAVAMGLVFWIGWSLPASFEQAREPESNAPEEPKVEKVHGSGKATAVKPAPVAPLPARPSPAAPARALVGLLDLNRATEQDFDALPGIGPTLAQRIMEYRQSVGAFRSLDELREVKGIGVKKFERIRPLVTVTPDASPIVKGKKAT
ncbi:MAG: helix-hairpin-helix domain-containing protein [Nitrospirae bacterium]|nr:helix-hairpin-helix domain-containing protein [Nitrospirota bacterium]